MSRLSHSKQTPLDFTDDDEFGEWLHARLESQYGFERKKTLLQRARSAENRLQAGRSPEKRLRVEVLRMKKVNAFIAPGRYLYITRDLLRRLPTEDAVALVVGHEIAHSDLGHLDFFQRRAVWKDLPGGDILAILLHITQRLAFSPEHERDADLYGLELCLEAGYRGESCLKALDVLEADLLKRGAETQVYGPEAARKPHTEVTDRWKAKAQVWVWERVNGYPSLLERRAALQARLKQRDSGIGTGNSPFQTHLPIHASLSPRLKTIDQALEAWSTDLALLSASLSELTHSAAYRRLAGSKELPPRPLTGASQTEVHSALISLQELGRQAQRLWDILDRAEEIYRSISRRNPSETALQELEHLLMDAPLSQSGESFSAEELLLLSSDETATPALPLPLLDRMMDAFESARDTVLIVDAVWSRWNPTLSKIDAEVTRLEQAVALLGMEASQDLALIQAQLAALRDQVETDPLSVCLDSDREVTLRIEAMQTKVRDWLQQRRQVEISLQRAWHLLEQMTGLSPSSCGQECERSRENGAFPAPLMDLARWLQLLEVAWKEGRWQTVSAGLEHWLQAARDYADGVME
jgi:Zn-dependent protease with chaperone function